MRVERTLQADDDLVGLYIYGFGRFGEIQAEKYYAELLDAFQFLSDNPLAAREHREFRPPVRIHHHDRHWIVYTIEPDAILIVRVLSDRVDLARHV